MADWKPKIPDSAWFGDGEDQHGAWWLRTTKRDTNASQTEEARTIFAATYDAEAETVSGEASSEGAVVIPFADIDFCQPIVNSRSANVLAAEWSLVGEE